MKKNKCSGFFQLPAFVVMLILFACGESEVEQSESEAQRKESNLGAVRSAILKTSGSISGEFSPTDKSNAKIVGRCDPDMFANFGVSFASDGWNSVGVSLMSDDEIKTGQTGSIELDWAYVSFTDDEHNSTEFRGPAEFVIASHDASPPRMTGTLKGALPGYGGLLSTPETKVLPDQSIEFEFTFDINAACGVVP